MSVTTRKLIIVTTRVIIAEIILEVAVEVEEAVAEITTAITILVLIITTIIIAIIVLSERQPLSSITLSLTKVRIPLFMGQSENPFRYESKLTYIHRSRENCLGR
jgi:hypothetical protein